MGPSWPRAAKKAGAATALLAFLALLVAAWAPASGVQARNASAPEAAEVRQQQVLINASDLQQTSSELAEQATGEFKHWETL